MRFFYKYIFSSTSKLITTLKQIDFIIIYKNTLITKKPKNKQKARNKLYLYIKRIMMYSYL